MFHTNISVIFAISKLRNLIQMPVGKSKPEDFTGCNVLMPR